MPRIVVNPVAGLIGAEIEGIDLSVPPDDGTKAVLREALARHLVIFLRDQKLDMAAHKRLTEIFGPVMRVPYVAPSREDPDVLAVLKEADETSVSVFGGDWHADFSFLENPPAGSVLRAVEVPPYGGDTLWANQIAAYETLPDDLRVVVDASRSVHVGAPYGIRHAPGAGTATSRSIRIRRGDPEADRERFHPAACVHEATGRRALFVNPVYTTRLDGPPEADDPAILRRLFDHAVRPEFTCRFRWTPDAVAIWDNRATLHYAINDYDGHRRLLYRTTFAGQPPR
jgi:taurine dioxygenase